jgi:NTP pyrophosphatase (non-canonical NTP hydrolase)
MDSIEDLRKALLRFRDEREWAQFHTLRNLIVSLNLEAGELLELTQWRGDEEMRALISQSDGREALAGECADILLYLILVADNAGIDLIEAARQKLERNSERYPVEKSRGSSAKYDRL